MAKYVTDLKAGEFFGDTAVNGFKIQNNQIRGVQTSKGDYEADIRLHRIVSLSVPFKVVAE